MLNSLRLDQEGMTALLCTDCYKREELWPSKQENENGVWSVEKIFIAFAFVNADALLLLWMLYSFFSFFLSFFLLFHFPTKFCTCFFPWKRAQSTCSRIKQFNGQM